MDSEEDMHDAYTSDGDYYPEEEEEYNSEPMNTDDDDDAVYSFDAAIDDMNPVSRLPQHNYHIMNEDEILKRQDEAVRSIANVLSISKTEASILLRHYKWCVNTVNEKWFNDEKRVRKKLGLLDRASPSPKPSAKEITCNICFDDFPTEKMKAAGCSHYFCESCWRSYMHTSITDGPGCLSLRCPDTVCSSAVGEDMIRAVVTPEDWKKYMRYLLRSFVEDSRQAKWCPAPGCDFAVEYYPGAGTYEIVCQCSHNFCWKCLEEAHRPVECETVKKWILKNSAESENMNWILANSKPCPKCRRPIEKFTGCMHMTCTPPCKYEFCWLCLGPWMEHGERTGGFYACNRYEAAKQDGQYDEAERRRDMAKCLLERYTHYYERWASNESSRVKALKDYREMVSKGIEKLSDRQFQPVSQLKFVTEALHQVVECRRILKWTYAYGYYIPEHEHSKRQFFEYVQGEAEAGLERLHQCAEKELQVFLDDDEQPTIPFDDYRTKLAGLTSVTRTYFENLVRALETGLADVDNSTAAATAGSSKASGSKSKNKKAKASGPATTGGGGGNLNRPAPSRSSIDDSGHWSCEFCTFANEITFTSCSMCHNPKRTAAA